MAECPLSNINGAMALHPKALKGLGPVSYKVTVTDSDGKVGHAEANIDDPNLKVEIKKIKDVTSNPPALGSAEVVLKGSVAGFKFQWDNGEKGKIAQQLEEGIHKVTVTDSFGCMAEESVPIVKEIEKLTAKIVQTKKIKCSSDETAVIVVETSGGKAPFEYKWDKDRFAGKTVGGVRPGTYSVTVSDALGQVVSANTTINAAPQFKAEMIIDQPATPGNKNGKATVKAKGGVGRYKYLWSNGETTEQAVQLAPSDHAVTVTDEDGCKVVIWLKMEENILPLSVSISQKTK